MANRRTWLLCDSSISCSTLSFVNVRRRVLPIALIAARERQQKDGDALHGAALTSSEHEVARGRQLASQCLIELEAEHRVLGSGLAQDRDWQAAHAGRLHGLRIHGMLDLHAESDDIAWIGEAHDLTAAVSQDLVEGDGASLDAVDV
jgi:hypothetical protein